MNYLQTKIFVAFYNIIPLIENTSLKSGIFYMIYEVEAKADLCEFNHACLHDPNFKFCKVERCVNNKVYFVQKENKHCPYARTFGYSFHCICPVRKEIYDKYKE